MVVSGHSNMCKQIHEIFVNIPLRQVLYHSFPTSLNATVSLNWKFYQNYNG